MRYCRALVFACTLLFWRLARSSRSAPGPGRKDPIERIPTLLKVLHNDGFEVLQGNSRSRSVKHACEGAIPSAWYNNVEPYLAAVLPGAVDDPVPWEKTERKLFPAYLFRQDEALLLVGSTPPPMAFYSFQTFLFMRYNSALTNTIRPPAVSFGL